MLDRPPPLPRCSRTSRVSRMLVMTTITISVYANAVMAWWILSEGTGGQTRIAGRSTGQTSGFPQTEGVEVRLAVLGVDEPAPNVGAGHSQRLGVQDRNGHRLGLDLLVQLAPQ